MIDYDEKELGLIRHLIVTHKDFWNYKGEIRNPLAKTILGKTNSEIDKLKESGRRKHETR